jgi:hypothetical protein
MPTSAAMIRAYVLSYLNSVGFLPSYAFPTDTTSLFLESETTELSQDSVQALKDYAPGQLVYARGTKWLVDEVDLRRANLVNADGAGAIPTVNICLRCDTVNDKTAASCLSCDSSELQAQVAVPMRAMRAERRQRISSDEEHRARRPFDVTHHLGAPQTAETWLFEHPGLVMQWERGSHLTVLNRGRLSNVPGVPAEQFLICTSCGMTFEPPGTAGPTQAQRKRDEWHGRQPPPRHHHRLRLARPESRRLLRRLGKSPHPRTAGSRQGKTRRPPRRRMERPDLLGRPDRPRRRRLRTRDHRRPECRVITGSG